MRSLRNISLIACIGILILAACKDTKKEVDQTPTPTPSESSIPEQVDHLQNAIEAYDAHVLAGKAFLDSSEYKAAIQEFDKALAAIDQYVTETKGSKSDIDNGGEQANSLKQEAEKRATCNCDPKTFRVESDHSYAQFNMPQSTAGTIIEIPGGSYNKYVFPKCNRVTWTNLRFQCDPETCTWISVSGKWEADNLCHGGKPDSPYLEVGDK